MVSTNSHYGDLAKFSRLRASTISPTTNFEANGGHTLSSTVQHYKIYSWWLVRVATAVKHHLYCGWSNAVTHCNALLVTLKHTLL